MSLNKNHIKIYITSIFTLLHLIVAISDLSDLNAITYTITHATHGASILCNKIKIMCLNKERERERERERGGF